MSGHPTPDGSGAMPPVTWRDALTDAQSGIDHAYEQRRAVITAAHDAGLSLRKIADVIGISAAGVHRIVGKAPANVDAGMDALANLPEVTRTCGGRGGFGPGRAPDLDGMIGWLRCPGCADCEGRGT